MVTHFFRRYQQPLLVVFTVLIIISFVGFFDKSGFIDRGGGMSRAATIYGRSVTAAEVLRESRKFELARELGLMDLAATLAGRAQTMDDAAENFVWNGFILRHEAEALGIGTTDEEEMAVIKQMPAFQTNGAFDSSKYAMILEKVLQPRGLGDAQLTELARDQVKLQKLKAVLAATTVPAPSTVRLAYDARYQKYETSVVRLPLADFLATATAPDDEVQKLFESRKSQLKSDEMRTVRYAAFILPTTDKPLEGKERAKALADLGKAAEDFSVAMTEKNADFATAAAKAKATVAETPEFTEAAPPPEFATAPAVAAAAFKLSKKDPNSDVLTTDRGYYVLQLAGITEARPLTFEEAKPKLVDQIKHERAQEALDLKGKEVHAKLEAELKAGKSFADAAQTAGVKVETFPVFSRAEPSMGMPDGEQIMAMAGNMKVGQLSEFTPASDGSLFVYVDKLLPIDDSKFATMKGLIENSFTRMTSDALFAEWLKLRRAEARITNGRG